MLRSLFETTGFEIRRLPSVGVDDYVRLFGAAAVNEKRFYNVGAGAFSHPCWTNLDCASTWYETVQRDFIEYNLMGVRPIPIPDGTAEIIYSSHVIEHIEEDAVARFFRECHRALRPGGILRITCGPDADLDLAALRRGDEDWFYWDRSARPIEHKWLYHLATSLAPHDGTHCHKFSVAEVREALAQPDALDRLTGLVHYQYKRPGNHVSWWNADKLLCFMREAGFDAYRSGHGQSVCPVLRNTRFFDNTHPQISLYVEAVR